MGSFAIYRYAFSISAVCALLSGCGGSQPPIGATLQVPAAAGRVSRGASWMLPEAKRDDLIYVSNSGHAVRVYDYATRRMVGRLEGFQTAEGECASNQGDVYITDSTANDVSVYRHGETSPSLTLEDSQMRPFGCSVDPASGDLCVANFDESSVSVYPRGTSSPKIYSTKGLVLGDTSCAYDDKGDMFAAGPNDSRSGLSQFAYLPKGARRFVAVNPLVSSNSIWINVTSVQWDGAYWEIAADGA